MSAKGPFHFSYIYLHKYFYNFSKFIHHTILIFIFNQIKLQKFWVTESGGVFQSPPESNWIMWGRDKYSLYLIFFLSCYNFLLSSFHFLFVMERYMILLHGSLLFTFILFLFLLLLHTTCSTCVLHFHFVFRKHMDYTQCP